MSRLTAFFHHLVESIQPIVSTLGVPGLAVVAFLDASFLSLPEVADALVMITVIQRPDQCVMAPLFATMGSVAGCSVLYLVARKGGEAFLRKRLRERHITRGLGWFKRHGMFALIVPAVMPPPMPFKLFVLLAGIADVKPATFVFAVAVGKGARFGGEAWLAYHYGERAHVFIRNNLPAVSLWLAAVFLVLAVGVILWRRRRGGKPRATGHPVS